MFEDDLARIINKGNCYVLIGAGPSCEIGYPSWKELATTVKNFVKLEKHKTGEDDLFDSESYEKYLTSHKYPELFTLAEKDCGSAKLYDFLKSNCRSNIKVGDIYDILTRWPFACYLTTNYDDEIEKHLSKNAPHTSFRKLQNTASDFFAYRSDSRNLIQKLHSDLEHPDNIILTSKQYNRLKKSECSYYRAGLQKLFTSNDFLIIGTSFSDPDLKEIIEIAKEYASPLHPIYMIGTGYTKAEFQELSETYNIRLFTYQPDEHHTGLLRILKMLDGFVVSRIENRDMRWDTRNIEESNQNEEKALALFLYKNLQKNSCEDYLSFLVISELYTVDKEHCFRTFDELLKALQKTSRKEINASQLQNAMTELVESYLLTLENNKYFLSPTGKAFYQQITSKREHIRQQALSEFKVDLETLYPPLTTKELQFCQTIFRRTLTSVFKSRAFAITNKIFYNESPLAGQRTDIFKAIADEATQIINRELIAAYIEACKKFLIYPTEIQIEYLTGVSQGFFLHNLLGNNNSLVKVRQELFRKSVWVLDSNVIIPLLTKNSFNNKYIKDLIEMLKKEDVLLLITKNLLYEVEKHLRWAIDFVTANGTESKEFYYAALGSGDYSSNLFLDGYISSSSSGECNSFQAYLQSIFGGAIDINSGIIALLKQYNIKIVTVKDIIGYELQDDTDIEEVREKIHQARASRGIFRSSLQVDTEAEIIVILEKLKSQKYSLGADLEQFYFLSQSKLLNSIETIKITSWTPEQIFRFLTALSDSKEVNDLQTAMLDHYYSSGVNYFNPQTYKRYFKSAIDEAKINYSEERDAYITSFEYGSASELDTLFEKTPDLEKPSFTYNLLKNENLSLRKKNAESTSELEKLKRENEELKNKYIYDQERTHRLTDREIQEKARLRNLEDPKHVAKRKRQSKNRKRK